MPDIIIHASMGNEVRKRLGMDFDDDLFRFGLLGPDPFLYCWPKYDKYSSIMHRYKTGDFLLELAKNTHGKKTFSYLSGFLCHYALDTAAHPYIVGLAESVYGKTRKASYLHIAIEHRLDILDGGKLKIPPFPTASIKGALDCSVEKVYGWTDAWKKMKTGYWHIKPFYAMVNDRYGVFNRMFSHFGEKASMITSQSKAADGIDLSGFYPLYEASIDDAVRYVKCARAFVSGRADEEEFRKVIGDKPYMPLN